MMRKRSFLALTLFWTFYVWVVGGLALSNLESPSKCSELSKCNEGLINVPSTNDTQTMCRDMEKCYDWSAVNSTFVAFTAMTTIGYGVQAPETAQGRIYCVFYTLVGIPLNLYYIATIAGYLTKFVENILDNNLPGCVDERHIQRWKFVAGVGLAFVFFVLFLLLPALGFMYWESENEWTFIDSFYFSFVTLSTIGFGDLVANNNDGKRKDLDLTFETSNLTSSTAEIVIMIWIITGLSFLMMVFNLITDFTGRVLKSSVERLRKKEAEVYEAYESTMESTTERAIMNWALSLKKTSRLTNGERKYL